MSWALGSRILARYSALQSPGWTIAAAVLAALVHWEWFDVGVAVALWAMWVAKDFALYPFLRHAYEPGDPDATKALVGRTGTARERLDPRGYVRVGSELWRAELAPGAPPVETGGAVRVVAVRGLTLVVEPVGTD